MVVYDSHTSTPPLATHSPRRRAPPWDLLHDAGILLPFTRLREIREVPARRDSTRVFHASFGGIISSLVADVIMPPIGMVLGNADFANLFVTLKEGAKAAGPYASLADAKFAGAVTMNVGLFANTIVSFLIVAYSMFLVIRGMNRMKKETQALPELHLPVVTDARSALVKFCLTPAGFRR